MLLNVFGGGERRGRSLPIRFVIAGVIALVSLCTYYTNTRENEYTGESERVGIDERQEAQLGLQAAPELIAQHKGEVDPNSADGRRVDEVGQRLTDAALRFYNIEKHPYEYEFYLLKDTETINAFALPGGQVFITRALYNEFNTEGQLAGVLGHEIGHVIQKHSAERMAQVRRDQGLTGAAGVATGDANTARIAAMVTQMATMAHGRDQELESDRIGVDLMVEAGYDPRAMIDVMKVLKAAGGGGQPEFFSTHPNPENRIEQIEDHIVETFPQGVPSELKNPPL